jgi:hypothetical protein
MTEANLPDLPVEIHHRIFHYCDARTILCKIRLVCKTLRDAVNRYNQIQLEFNPKTMMYLEGYFRSVSSHAVSSLIISFENEYVNENEKNRFIFSINRFTETRHFSLRGMGDRNLQRFLTCANHLQYWYHLQSIQKANQIMTHGPLFYR